MYSTAAGNPLEGSPLAAPRRRAFRATGGLGPNSPESTGGCRWPRASSLRSGSPAKGTRSAPPDGGARRRRSIPEGLLGQGAERVARIYLVAGKAPSAGHWYATTGDRKEPWRCWPKVGPRRSIGAVCSQAGAGRAATRRPVDRDDLAGYRVVEREPIVATYQGVRIVSAPPPSSGGVWLAERTQHSFRIRTRRSRRVTRQHLVLESMRRAQSRPAQYLANPPSPRFRSRC